MTGRQIMATLQDELAKRDAALHYRTREEVYTQLGQAMQVVADKLAADITDQLNRHIQKLADDINTFADQMQVNEQLLRLLAERMGVKPTTNEEEEQRDAET